MTCLLSSEAWKNIGCLCACWRSNEGAFLVMLDISRLFGISYLNNCFSVLQVLSIMDSSYHILKDMKVPSVRQFREKRKHDQELEAVLDYKEKISVNISFIGISLISSYPQVCEKIIFSHGHRAALNSRCYHSLVGIAFCMCQEHEDWPASESGSSKVLLPNLILANR